MPRFMGHDVDENPITQKERELSEYGFAEADIPLLKTLRILKFENGQLQVNKKLAPNRNDIIEFLYWTTGSRKAPLPPIARRILCLKRAIIMNSVRSIQTGNLQRTGENKQLEEIDALLRSDGVVNLDSEKCATENTTFVGGVPTVPVETAATTTATGCTTVVNCDNSSVTNLLEGIKLAVDELKSKAPAGDTSAELDKLKEDVDGLNGRVENTNGKDHATIMNTLTQIKELLKVASKNAETEPSQFKNIAENAAAQANKNIDKAHQAISEQLRSIDDKVTSLGSNSKNTKTGVNTIKDDLEFLKTAIGKINCCKDKDAYIATLQQLLKDAGIQVPAGPGVEAAPVEESEAAAVEAAAKETDAEEAVAEEAAKEAEGEEAVAEEAAAEEAAAEEAAAEEAAAEEAAAEEAAKETEAEEAATGEAATGEAAAEEAAKEAEAEEAAAEEAAKEAEAEEAAKETEAEEAAQEAEAKKAAQEAEAKKAAKETEAAAEEAAKETEAVAKEAAKEAEGKEAEAEDAAKEAKGKEAASEVGEPEVRYDSRPRVVANNTINEQPPARFRGSNNNYESDTSLPRRQRGKKPFPKGKQKPIVIGGPAEDIVPDEVPRARRLLLNNTLDTVPASRYAPPMTPRVTEPPRAVRKTDTKPEALVKRPTVITNNNEVSNVNEGRARYSFAPSTGRRVAEEPVKIRPSTDEKANRSRSTSPKVTRKERYVALSPKAPLYKGMSEAIKLEGYGKITNKAQKVRQLEQLIGAHTWQNKSFAEVKELVDEFLSDFGEKGTLKTRLNYCSGLLKEDTWPQYLEGLFEIIKTIPDPPKKTCVVRTRRARKNSNRRTRKHRR